MGARIRVRVRSLLWVQVRVRIRMRVRAWVQMRLQLPARRMCCQRHSTRRCRCHRLLAHCLLLRYTCCLP